ALADPARVGGDGGGTAGAAVARDVHEVADLVAELHQHAVPAAHLLAAAALVRAGAFAALDHGALAQELGAAVDREAGGAQVVHGRGALGHGAVADVEHGHPAAGRFGQELGRARQRRRRALAHPVVPAGLVEAAAAADQPRLVGGVVEHGLVDVDDDRRRQPGRVVVAVFPRQRVPGGIGQRLLQVAAGGAVHLAGDQVALDRGLVPDGGVEAVV